MRVRTYGVQVPPFLQAYIDRVVAHPARARWIEEAVTESERIEKYDNAEMPGHDLSNSLVMPS